MCLKCDQKSYSFPRLCFCVQLGIYLNPITKFLACLRRKIKQTNQQINKQIKNPSNFNESKLPGVTFSTIIFMIFAMFSSNIHSPLHQFFFLKNSNFYPDTCSPGKILYSQLLLDTRHGNCD